MDYQSIQESAAKVLPGVLEKTVEGSDKEIAESLTSLLEHGDGGDSFIQHDARCAVCGKNVDAGSAQSLALHLSRAKRIAQREFICEECCDKLSDVVTPAILSNMTAEQVRRHIEAADGLRELYQTQFKATRTFYSGKDLDRPTFEVDEAHGWWAIPNAKNPMVFSLDNIVDVKMTVKTTRFFSELDSAISINALVDAIRKVIRSILVFFMAKKYHTPYSDLPAIPKDTEPFEMTVLLTLDHDAGLTEACIDVGGPKITVPRNVQGAYECAHQIIEFVKELQHKRFMSYVPSGNPRDGADPEWLKRVAEESGVGNEDFEYLRYYVTRIPKELRYGAHGEPVNAASPLVDKLTLVNNVIAWVSKNLCKGYPAPSWETQTSADIRAFMGAFVRYAPGVSFSDIVCIHDETNVLSGKGGMLFAANCFAVDALGVAPDERLSLMPVYYDDLLCVSGGTEGVGVLRLVYRDGHAEEIAVEKYAHYLLAVINCILYLRSFAS